MTEIAFQELATQLHCEVAEEGFPSATYFVYCLTLIAYDILSVVNTALCVVQKETNSLNDVSWHYLANEINSAWRGMMIALPSHNWSYAFADVTTRQLTNTLMALANNVCLPVAFRPLQNQEQPTHTVKNMHFRLFHPSNAPSG